MVFLQLVFSLLVFAEIKASYKLYAVDKNGHLGTIDRPIHINVENTDKKLRNRLTEYLNEYLLRPKKQNNEFMNDDSNNEQSKTSYSHRSVIKSSPITYSHGRYILDLDKLNENEIKTVTNPNRVKDSDYSDYFDSDEIFREYYDYINKHDLKKHRHLHHIIEPIRRYNEILLGDKKQYRANSDFYTSEEIREKLNKNKKDFSEKRKEVKKNKKKKYVDSRENEKKLKKNVISSEGTYNKRKPVTKRFKIIHNRDPKNKNRFSDRHAWVKPKKTKKKQKFSSEESSSDEKPKKMNKIKSKYVSDESSDEERKKYKKSKAEIDDDGDDESLFLQGNKVIKLYAHDTVSEDGNDSAYDVIHDGNDISNDENDNVEYVSNEQDRNIATGNYISNEDNGNVDDGNDISNYEVGNDKYDNDISKYGDGDHMSEYGDGSIKYGNDISKYGDGNYISNNQDDNVENGYVSSGYNRNEENGYDLNNFIEDNNGANLNDNIYENDDRNDRDLDAHGRRRLPHFLPKRYHWKPSEIHHLGYYWFDGPRGSFPGPIGLH